MRTSTYRQVAASSLFVVAGLLPSVGRAQSDDAAARRHAILQQDQSVNDEGQLIDQDATLVAATRAGFRGAPDSAPVQQVRWRRGAYYGGGYNRPYAAYYGGSRYSAPFPRNYEPYYGGYRYGYRTYGPGYGYYGYGDPYFYGGGPYGTARVGRFRVFW